MQIKLMRTKAGRGFKVVVGNTWYYTSIKELTKALAGSSTACVFRTIDDNTQ